MRPMTRERRLSSLCQAGATSAVRTSIVPRASGVGHRGHVEQCLDRAIPELPPDPRVFLPDHLLRRMRRPGDADAAQVVEADLDAAIDPVQQS